MQNCSFTDETLVLLTLAGKPDAYEQLILRYERAVIASARSVTRYAYIAQDAAQDAFVTAWMKLNTLREPSKYGAWVCRIAKNCAKNMVMRYRSFMPLDTLDYSSPAAEDELDPARIALLEERYGDLYQGMEALPAQVLNVIRLHYFEDLSVAQIAERLGCSPGTVKWQLHEGRKKIRKELCAMDESYNDTLVERVMKKVAELKLWQLKNDKSGFEEVWRDVLREVEELPESRRRSHALADVLMRGWWWLEGEQNDALMERITRAAIEGNNEEVMCFVAEREANRMPWGVERADYLRQVQIPRLIEQGFARAAGVQYYALGELLWDDGKGEEGDEAFDACCRLLGADDATRALAVAAKHYNKTVADGLLGEDKEAYKIGAYVYELVRVDCHLRMMKEIMNGHGTLYSYDTEGDAMIREISRADGYLFGPDLTVGQTFEASDGSTLTLVSTSERVEVPCGVFEGCHLYVTRRRDCQTGTTVSRCFCKQGVGIVRFERIADDLVEARVLKDYHIAGGDGLLPLACGNRWEYVGEFDSASLDASLICSVRYEDGERAVMVSEFCVKRREYDEASWVDAIQEVRNEYFKYEQGKHPVHDVTPAAARARALAKTPLEKLHTEVMSEVIERIIRTDSVLHPETKTHGYWNFFRKEYVFCRRGRTELRYNPRWSFELKGGSASMGNADRPLLYNDILGILYDAVGCIWSDEWRPGEIGKSEHVAYGKRICTYLTCEQIGRVEVACGAFEGCLRLSLDMRGLEKGLAYRTGKKEYIFAEGIGIIRVTNEYPDSVGQAVYELTSYEGEGEGYMPMHSGMKRRYDAIGMTDGFEGAVEYTWAEDGYGEIVIFTNQIGVRRLPPPITQYGAIQDEVIEENLWNKGEHEKSRLRHDVNNFRLLLHFFARPSRYWAAPEKAVAWNKYRLRIMEGLDPSGEVPRAWLGHYASTSFRTACALFGMGRSEEGWEYLERAFERYPLWDAIPEGEEMEVGDPLIWGGIKVIKGSAVILLPGGEREGIDYEHLFTGDASLMHYGMTAPQGWEWFNPVREEARFKEYVKRAEAMRKK